jgi:hypothetical protein
MRWRAHCITAGGNVSGRNFAAARAIKRSESRVGDGIKVWNSPAQKIV